MTGRSARRSLRLALAVAGSVLAAGCASRTPTPAAASAPPPLVTEARQRLVDADGLCKQLAADPALAPLRGRLVAADPAQSWTRAMMTDPGHVDERDRALLLLLDERRAACRQAQFVASPQQTVPLLDYWRRQDAALVRLYQREITIGSYNRAMAEAQQQLSIDTTNMAADIAMRANQGATPTATTTAPQLGPASFRALPPR